MYMCVCWSNLSAYGTWRREKRRNNFSTTLALLAHPWTTRTQNESHAHANAHTHPHRHTHTCTHTHTRIQDQSDMFSTHTHTHTTWMCLFYTMASPRGGTQPPSSSRVAVHPYEFTHTWDIDTHADTTHVHTHTHTFCHACVALFYEIDVWKSWRSRDFLKGGPGSTYPRNQSPTYHLTLFFFREPGLARPFTLTMSLAKPILSSSSSNWPTTNTVDNQGQYPGGSVFGRIQSSLV